MKAINQSLLSHTQIFKERFSYRSKDQKSALTRFTLKRSFLNSFTATATRESGGAKRDRTADLLRAKQALSQLSYSPKVVGQGRLELPTSPLSGVRSNRLSYRPITCAQSSDLNIEPPTLYLRAFFANLLMIRQCV